MLKYSIVQRNKATGSKTWYLRTFDTESKRIKYESLNTEKKGEAQSVLLRKNAELFKTPEQLHQENQPTIREAVYKWLDIVSRGKQGTFMDYKNKVPHLLDFCKRNNIERLGKFTTKEATELINELPPENKPVTILNKKRVYTAFFNWAFSTYGIEKINPFTRVKTPKVSRKEREFWTPEQLGQILDGASDKTERLLFAFMAFAGLRFFEAAGLRWEQLDGGKLSIMGKGDKPARVPIGRRLEDEIKKFLGESERPESGQIFESPNNSSENTKVKKICERLGIPGAAHCHKFRHSFASNLLRAGGSIVAVSKLMRHENPDITLRFYSHCLPDDLEKTLNLI
jgi:integrase